MPLMLSTRPASRAGSWLKTSVLGGWILWCAATAQDEVQVVGERPALRQAPHPFSRELCLNLGDAHHQAARFLVWLVTSTPSLNLIPSMTFGN